MTDVDDGYTIRLSQTTRGIEMLERIERELLKTVPDADCPLPEDVAVDVFQNILDTAGNLQHDLN